MFVVLYFAFELFSNFHFPCSNESIEKNSNIIYLAEHHYFTDRNHQPYFNLLNRHIEDDIVLVFFYGDDFSITNYRRNLFKLAANIWIPITFSAVGFLMLYFMRRGDLNRQNIFIRVWMDIMIAVISGSSIRYQNRLEKIFFAIFLVGVFFINTIFVENFLFYVFVTEEPNRMDTLKKFAKFNQTIFVSNDPIFPDISIDLIRYDSKS